MAWSTTYTAAANSVMTAAQWNQNVRDNLLLTEASLAQSWGSRFVSTGANAITQRGISSILVTATQTTTSTSYVNLSTVGPTVSMQTGTTAIAMWSATASVSVADALVRCSVDVSGASTVAASDDWALLLDGLPAGVGMKVSSAHRFTGLTAGINTFTMKYSANSGTATFSNRNLIVIPF